MVSSAQPEPEAQLRQKLFVEWGYTPEQSFFLAFSGGADSTAMMLAAHALGLQLRLLHVNHHWHADSSKWAAYAQEQAERHGYSCQVLDLVADQDGEGPEDRARRGRYALLAAQLGKGDCLLTAQHRDDQAETLFLQLLRGAGIAGLAAMPERRRLGAGILARPFLGLSRLQLRQYLQERGAHWLEDPANDDLRYARVRLRRRIWPLLEDLGWPQAAECIARSAANIADQLAVEDAWYASLTQPPQPQGAVVAHKLSVREITQLAPALQRVFLRHWLRDRDLPVPDQAMLERLRQLCGAQQGGKSIEFLGVHAWRQGEQLQLWPQLPAYSITEQDWQPGYLEGQGEGFRWCWGKGRVPPPGMGGDAVAIGGEELKNSRLSWSLRAPGMGYRNPAGQHRPIKKLLLELGVPPFLRSHIPILFSAAEEILWIPGFYQRSPQQETSTELLWVVLVSD